MCDTRKHRSNYSLFLFARLLSDRLFLVEIMSLIDPIIFKFDGFVYAITTVAWGLIIGLTSSQAKNWADEI